MIALCQKIVAERSLLQQTMPNLVNSQGQLRYLSSNFNKINEVLGVLSRRYQREKTLSDSLDDYIAYRDAVEIHKACEGIGVDQKKIADVICNRQQESIINTAAAYKQYFGKDMEGLLVSEGKTILGMLLTNELTDISQFIMYRVMVPARRDAYILKDWCVRALSTTTQALLKLLI